MAKHPWPDWDIYVRDGCTCAYCGFQGISPLSWRQLAIDHIVPKAKGGPDARENKVVSCNYCNTMKSGFDPSDGQWHLVLSDEARLKLIEKSREHIRWAISNNYGGPDKEQKDFKSMMEEIKRTREPGSGLNR